MKGGLFTLFLSVLILFPLGMSAQKGGMLVKAECDSWRGTDLSAGSDALCLTATGAVQEVHIDSAHATLYALIRESKKGKLIRSGHLVAYNLSQNSELWTKPFDFTRDQFFLVDTLPVVSGKEGSFCLDRQSGEELWRTQVEIGLITRYGVGLGKAYNVIVGLDLRNGKELWRKSGRFDNVASFEVHGDTAALFLKNGLNFLDLQTGDGFTVEAKTFEGTHGGAGVSPGGAVAIGVLGALVTGLVFGVAVIVVPAYGYGVNQRADNALTQISLHDEHAYFSSRDEFYKVNLKGEIVWQQPVEKAIGVSRKVFVANDAAYLISKGVVATANGPIYSDAVLYKMNVDGTGLIRGVQLNTGNREYVQDFLIKDSTIVVALNNRIVEIRLDDLSTLREKSFGDSNQNAGFGAILNPPAILFEDSAFVMASEKYPDDFFVENPGGMKIRFSEELTPVEAIRQKNYFAIQEVITGNDMLVSNGADVYLIDSNGNRLSDFSFSSGMKYVGGKEFDFDQNQIIMIQE